MEEKEEICNALLFAPVTAIHFKTKFKAASAKTMSIITLLLDWSAREGEEFEGIYRGIVHVSKPLAPITPGNELDRLPGQDCEVQYYL